MVFYIKKIVWAALLSLLVCELRAQVEEDKLQIYANPNSSMTRAQIENLLKKVRRDRYHVYEEHSIDSLMVPGSIWRDTSGHYLKYMDWAVTETDTGFVWYKRVWILNHDHDSVQIFAEFPVVIENDTIKLKGLTEEETFTDVNISNNSLYFFRKYNKHTTGLLTDAYEIDTLQLAFVYGDSANYHSPVDVTGEIPIVVNNNNVSLNYKYPLYVENDTLTVFGSSGSLMPDTTIRTPDNFCIDERLPGMLISPVDEVFYPDWNELNRGYRGLVIIDHLRWFLMDKPYKVASVSMRVPSGQLYYDKERSTKKAYFYILIKTFGTNEVVEVIKQPVYIPYPSSKNSYTTVNAVLEIPANYEGYLWTKPIFVFSPLLNDKSIQWETDMSSCWPDKQILFGETIATYCYDSSYGRPLTAGGQGMEQHGLRSHWHKDFGASSNSVYSKVSKENNALKVVNRRHNFDKGILYSDTPIDSFTFSAVNNYYNTYIDTNYYITNTYNSDVHYMDTNYYFYNTYNIDTNYYINNNTYIDTNYYITNNYGTGEATTASNLGGVGLYNTKIGSELKFKGLEAGSNITLDNSNPNYIKINSTASGSVGITTESDPVFSAHAAKNITTTNIGNWNNGFISSVAAPISFSNNNLSLNGLSGYGASGQVIKSNGTSLYWAEDLQGTTTETDPVFSASAAKSITTTNISNWNNLVGHTHTGLITSAASPLSLSNGALSINLGNYITADQLNLFAEGINRDYATKGHTHTEFATTSQIANSGNWNTAYGWGNHANAGYLTNANLSSTYATKTEIANSGNWNTAYGWGNHANAGYMKLVGGVYQGGFTVLDNLTVQGTIMQNGQYVSLANHTHTGLITSAASPLSLSNGALSISGVATVNSSGKVVSNNGFQSQGQDGAGGSRSITYVTGLNVTREEIDVGVTSIKVVTSVTATTATATLNFSGGLYTGSSGYSAIDVKENKGIDLTLEDFQKLEDESWKVDEEYLEFLEFKKWKKNNNDKLKEISNGNLTKLEE